METLALILATIIFTVTVPDSWYQMNTHESCPETAAETTKEMREECYIKQDVAEFETKYGHKPELEQE